VPLRGEFGEPGLGVKGAGRAARAVKAEAAIIAAMTNATTTNKITRLISAPPPPS
jgi:hypothetical protein